MRSFKFQEISLRTSINAFEHKHVFIIWTKGRSVLFLTVSEICLLTSLIILKFASKTYYILSKCTISQWNKCFLKFLSTLRVIISKTDKRDKIVALKVK